MDDRDVSLSGAEKERYNRQIIYPSWGEAAQKRIREATVLIAGAGGLGSSAAIYLAAAGIGCIRICDSDRVELSNLNRQVLHSDEDIGKPKTRSAVKTLTRINPHVRTVALCETISKKNIAGIIGDASIVIDCLDNFETRFVINAYAVQHGLPFVHAGVYGMAGQITFIHPPETPCLQCIFPSAPPRETFPIVGAAPGVLGCLEALEALKFLAGINTLFKNRLLIWEGDMGNFEEIRIEKNPSCAVCSGIGAAKE